MSPAIVLNWLTGEAVLLTIALFALIIVFHEFGHFMVAKLSGMPVHEFSLGFGRPVLLSVNWRGTRCCVRPIPIGGFVRIAGMEPDEDVPNGFDKKPIWSRLGVIASGSGMNFVLAVLLFWIIGMAYGKIVGDSTRLASVLPGTPAAAVGLAAGDRLVNAEPVPVIEAGPAVSRAAAPPQRMNTDRLRSVIGSRPDMPVRVVVLRRGKYLAFRVTPRSERQKTIARRPDGKLEVVMETVGRIGVVFTNITRPMGFWESVGAGFVRAYDTTAALLKGLVLMVMGKLPADVGGPVAVGDLMADAARLGWRQFLFWSALISINVGVINLLPVPALDGSRLVFIVIEGIRRRPIDKRKEAIVHLVGFALLLLLLALVTLKDIVGLIDKYVG